MAVLVKICGLRSHEAVDAAIRAGADMLGFVLFAPSPRHIEVAAAAAVVADLPPAIRSVVLTVDADDRLIETVASRIRPSMIQAHGRESPDRIAAIASLSGLPVMKALAVSNPRDLDAAPAYADVADALLFDAKPPRGADRPGGHGRAFDWKLARAYRGPLPWMLSGGLDAGNVAAAIAASRAPGVDVSSGVERDLGVKDPDLIRRFVAAVREAETAAPTLTEADR